MSQASRRPMLRSIHRPTRGWPHVRLRGGIRWAGVRLCIVLALLVALGLGRAQEAVCREQLEQAARDASASPAFFHRSLRPSRSWSTA